MIEVSNPVFIQVAILREACSRQWSRTPFVNVALTMNATIKTGCLQW